MQSCVLQFTAKCVWSTQVQCYPDRIRREAARNCTLTNPQLLRLKTHGGRGVEGLRVCAYATSKSSEIVPCYSFGNDAIGLGFQNLSRFQITSHDMIYDIMSLLQTKSEHRTMFCNVI